MARMAALVGREREQSRLRRAIADAAGGAGTFVVVRGEPGIGKTALVRWAVDEVGDGWWVLRGNAHPSGAHLSYGPIVEAVGRLLRGIGPEASTELTAGISGLGLLFPDLIGDEPPHAAEGDLSQTIALESLRALVVRLAARRPVMLVVDDLQWADPATLRTLGYLSGEVADTSIVVVVTLRDGDDARRPDVRAALASFRRVARVDVVTPQRLDATEVGAVLAAALGREADAAVVDDVLARSAGTPLYVEALAQQLAEAAGRPGTEALPGVVHDVIGELLGGVDGPALRLAQTAALCAEPMPEDLARRASGLDAEAFEAALADVTTRHLVDREDLGRGLITTAHPLIGEVVERSMSASQRAELHLGLLDAVGEGADPEIRVVHATGAGPLVDPAVVVDALTAAGRQAMRRRAYQSAIKYLGDALERAPDGSGPVASLEVRRMLIDALLRAGEYAAAEAVAREGLAEHAGSDDRFRLLHRLETACWLQGHGDVELTEMQAALDEIPTSDRRPAVLELAEHVVSAYARRERTADAGAAIADLIARTSDASDPDTQVLRAVALSSVALIEGRPVDAGPLIATARRTAEDHGLVPRLPRIELQELDAALLTGPVALVRRRGDSVRRNGSAPVPWRDQIVDHVCGLAALEPGWAVGVDDGAEAELTWPVRRPMTVAHRAWVTGDAELATAAVELALRIQAADRDDTRGIPDAAPRLVSTARVLLAGDRAGAAALVPELERDHQQVWWAPAGELVCAVAELAGAPELHRATCDSMRDLDQGRGWSSAIATLAAASLAPAEDRAPALLAAAERLDELGDRHRLAVALVGAVELGADGDVAARLEPLLDPVERCGLRPLARRIRDALGLSAPPEARPAALTRRQFEIAELVAQGLSNAAVADRLCISVRTVTSHLDHIYARLGVRNRTELAVRLPEWR